MFFLHLLDVCLNFVYHFAYFFHLVEELVHEAIASLHIDGDLILTDVLFVALGLIL